MDNTHYKIFIRFLKENNCYADFFKELKIAFRSNDNDDNKKSLYKYICRTYEPIMYSFSWDNSLKGSDFWMDMSTKWSNLILKILRNE